MSEELQQKLRAQLWEVANNLRGNMSANEFMYFSLGFIFYKYLSEKIENYADRALEDDEITFKQLWQSGEEDALELQEEVKKQCLENIGYFVEPQYLFTSIIDAIKRKENIIPSLERSLKRIEDSTLGQESEDDFGGLFSDIDLASPKLGKTTDDKNTLISNVLIALNGIDFGADEATQIDILGDAYEYMISQFAAGAGKKAGEFYTPQEVSQILAEIVTIGHTRLRNVYDPTCGSGSLLIRAAHTGRAFEIFGQEKNPTTYNLCRMNMLLHGIKFSNFQIENGDTLEADAFGDTQFDAVVANPPFSAEWSAADKFNNDDRFSRAGRLAPRKTADYAFILHMLYHLVDGGTMACVVPHGVLFRGNAEGVIRRFLIEKKNCIDAIIGLPANIFYGTSIPTCILVMKKCRKEDDNILFIDASKEFEKVKTQNKLRKEHIDKIVDTYRNRTEIEKYSHLATLQEVADNDYNLNIPRYVDTFEEEEPIDIKAVMAEIKGIAQNVARNNKPNIRLSECLECSSSTLQESDVCKNGTYPVYGANGIVGYLDNYNTEKEAVYIIKDGSGVGTVSYVTGKCSATGTLNTLQAKEGYSLQYLYYMLKVFNFEPYKTGMAIPHIYFKDYGKAKIFCPSYTEQLKYARLLSAIDNKLSAEQSILTDLSLQKQYLLRQMFI